MHIFFSTFTTNRLLSVLFMCTVASRWIFQHEDGPTPSRFTFLYLRMEEYSTAVSSWLARELTEDRGDLLAPLAPLPLTATGPLMAPFTLPFPRTPLEEKTAAVSADEQAHQAAPL